MTLPWRNCYASTTLVNEVNAKYPDRSKVSDGTIGDASHQSRTSDHNLTVKVGDLWVVRARDITKIGVDIVTLREHLRELGAKKDPRLYPKGYLISDKRITLPDFSGWKPYYGINAHEHHMHVSFTTIQSGFDSTAPWGISGVGTPAPITKAPEPPSPPQPGKEDPVTVIELEEYSDNTFRGACMSETGAAVSTVVARAWVIVGATWGSAKVLISCLNNSGGVMVQKSFDIPNNRRAVLELPAGTVMTTVEGSKSTGAVVSPVLLNLPR